ncbi:MAG TPA: hypothetical protein VJ201_05640 [Candidatus Babeliales bacterium]|nr:hypothetical protein [Candidatus Babeliales bacterium]
MSRLLGKTKEMLELSKKISNCTQIKKYDKPDLKGDPESWVIVYSLSEIEESCQKITQDLLNKLNQAEKPQEVFDVLSDIREELRHILYHIKDSEFFKIVV